MYTCEMVYMKEFLYLGVSLTKKRLGECLVSSIEKEK